MANAEDILGRYPMQKTRVAEEAPYVPFSAIIASFDLTSRSIPNHHGHYLQDDSTERRRTRKYKGEV